MSAAAAPLRSAPAPAAGPDNPPATKPNAPIPSVADSRGKAPPQRGSSLLVDPFQAVLSLLPDIYGAVEDPSRWQTFISRLSTLISTGRTVLLLQRLNCVPLNQTVLGIIGYDPAFVDSYNDYYGSKNVYLLHGRSKLTPGAVRFEEELCPRHIAERSEFFNDWLRPQRLGDSLFATVIEEEDLVGLLCVDHDEHAHPYEESDRRLVALLMPHLQQALRLYQRIAALKSRSDVIEGVLDVWPTGIIVLDKSGLPLVANRSARDILDTRSGLVIDRRELRAASVGETRLLRELVDNAIRTTATCCAPSRKTTSSVPGLTPGGLMLIGRSSGRPLQLMVSPVGSATSFPCIPGAAAIIFLNDPGATTPPERAEVLRSLYGLTETEGHVTRVLLDGVSLPAIAERLSISLNTAKTHAKHIYAKTGTKGQADLIRSEASSPAFVPQIPKHR